MCFYIEYGVFGSAYIPMHYAEIFKGCKNDNFQLKLFYIFVIFAENIDCGVLTSTHNLCFKAKIRKNVYTCKPHFYYIKVGCKWVFITLTCYDVGLILDSRLEGYSRYKYTQRTFYNFYRLFTRPIQLQGSATIYVITVPGFGKIRFTSPAG